MSALENAYEVVERHGDELVGSLQDAFRETHEAMERLDEGLARGDFDDDRQNVEELERKAHRFYDLVEQLRGHQALYDELRRALPL